VVSDRISISTESSVFAEIGRSQEETADALMVRMVRIVVEKIRSFRSRLAMLRRTEYFGHKEGIRVVDADQDSYQA
jgi:hypothetical protein